MTIGDPVGTMEEDEKPRTLLIGNLPRSTHKRQIEEVFGEVGPLKRCYIQYPRDDKKKRGAGDDSSTLLCYVTFALAEDAVKALETLGGHKFGGNKVHIKFTKTRSEQIRPRPENETQINPRKRDNVQEEDKRREDKNPNMIPVGGVKPERPKAPRVKTENKKSRLIIRNLSFKVTEEKMKEYFGGCGEIMDINILKKPDGKLVGCAFVQYKSVPQAAKAVRELNLKPFLGRPIAIDWALPKKDFQSGENDGKQPVDEIKIEDDGEEDVKVKVESEDNDSDGGGDVKFANPYESMDIDIKKEDPDNKTQNRKRKIKDESSSDDDDDDESDEEDDDDEAASKKPRRSNDVEEGKTLFLRNLEFSVTEDDLKQFFEAYGPIHYALLCKDNLTEHPKGTGFVKFIDASSANKCLTDFNIEKTKFRLANRLFTVAVALSKESVTSSSEKKEKIKHDNRNLYLVREGFIRPGSSAAEGVSISDMNTRASLNSTKKQLLKNLSIFVSPNRLCVHNLPLKLSDKGLRKLFKQYSPPEARITEARVMRDMKDIQLGGKGKSKGFGFITFNYHDHALAALRIINNNPEVFTSHQRPIVEFSLENRKALQAKEKRQQKSIENNKAMMQSSPKKKKGRKSETETKTSQADNNEIKTKPQTPQKPKRAPIKRNDDEPKSVKDVNFAGLTGKRGVSKLPVMKAKGKITRRNLKVKGSRKQQQKKLQERKMREPQIKPKRSIDKADKSEKLVTKYKERLEKSSSDGQQQTKKSKWYQ